MNDTDEATIEPIPDAFVEILEKQSFGHLATVGPDGRPQNSPVWVDHDEGKAVLINTAIGRQKERNLRENPYAMISITDPDDPYRYLAVRGRVTFSKDGAVDHIDALAKKYMGVDEYPNHGNESGDRIIIRLPAEEVVTRE